MTVVCEKVFLHEEIQGEELTCRYGATEEDRIGHEDEQHRCVRGDIVWDGMLEALFATT